MTDVRETVMNMMRGVTNSELAVREESERALSEIRKDDGFVRCLMNIVDDSSAFSENDRLISVCCLHENVKTYYKSTSQDCIHPNDKSYLRSNIIDSISLNHASAPICETYSCILHLVIEEDYPSRWSDISLTIVDRLNRCSKIEELYGCLQAVNILIRCMSTQSNAPGLMDIIEKVYPLYTSLIQNRMSQLHTAETHSILLQVFKSFLFTVSIDVYDHIDTDVWVTCLTSLLIKDLPDQLRQPARDFEETIARGRAPEWRLLHVCLQCLCLLSQQAASDPEDPPKLAFIDRHALQTADAVLSLLARQPAEFVSNECLSAGLKAVSHHLRIPRCQNKMREYLRKILFDLCLPLLRLNGKDLDYFRENNIDYVYSLLNKCDDHNSVKNQAEDLARQLCTRDSGLLFDLVNHVAATLSSNAELLAREAALHAMESVWDLVGRDASLAPQMEPFLSQFVLEGMIQEETPMRCRCLSVFAKLGAVCELRDQKLLFRACQAVTSGLGSGNVILKVHSADALRTLLQAPHIEALLEPEVEQLLGVVLEMMRELDCDNVVRTLLEVVRVFEARVQPFARRILSSLYETATQHFQGLAASENTDGQNGEQEPHNEAFHCFVQCAETLINVLQGLGLGTQVIEPFTAEHLALTERCLSFDDDTIFEYGLSLLNAFLFKTDRFTPELLRFFQAICEVVRGRGHSRWVYCVPQISACLINFVALADLDTMVADGLRFADAVFEAVRGIGVVAAELGMQTNTAYMMKILEALLVHHPVLPEPHVRTVATVCAEVFAAQRDCASLVRSVVSVLATLLAFDSGKYVEAMSVFEVSNGGGSLLRVAFDNAGLMNDSMTGRKKKIVMMCVVVCVQGRKKFGLDSARLVREVCGTWSMLEKEKERGFATKEGDYDGESDEWVEEASFEVDSWNGAYHTKEIQVEGAIREMVKYLEDQERDVLEGLLREDEAVLRKVCAG